MQKSRRVFEVAVLLVTVIIGPGVAFGQGQYVQLDGMQPSPQPMYEQPGIAQPGIAQPPQAGVQQPTVQPDVAQPYATQPGTGQPVGDQAMNVPQPGGTPQAGSGQSIGDQAVNTAQPENPQSVTQLPAQQAQPQQPVQQPGIAPQSAASTDNVTTDRVIGDSQYYIGANLGVGLLADGGGGHPGYGADAGIHFNREVSAGAFYSRVPRGSFSSAEAGGNDVGGAINYYGLEAQYHVERLPGFQIGGKVALGNNSVDVNTTTNSNTDLYFGPRVVYDFAIANAFTLGAEGVVLFSSADTARSTALLLASLKFWIG